MQLYHCIVVFLSMSIVLGLKAIIQVRDNIYISDPLYIIIVINFIIGIAFVEEGGIFIRVLMAIFLIFLMIHFLLLRFSVCSDSFLVRVPFRRTLKVYYNEIKKVVVKSSLSDEGGINISVTIMRIDGRNISIPMAFRNRERMLKSISEKVELESDYRRTSIIMHKWIRTGFAVFLQWITLNRIFSCYIVPYSF